MICKHKIGNLHTSYERMGDSYHLRAFFGVNVICAMNEILKFPGLFETQDLSQYLDNILVLPKRKTFALLNSDSYVAPKYLVEEKYIVPKLVSISGVGDGIFYFYFDQHFFSYEKKKYKIKISVIDKSINKATEARNKFIESNKVFLNIFNESGITRETIDLAIETSTLAQKIQRKPNSLYQKIIRSENISLSMIQDLGYELKKEIKFINQELGYDGKRYRGNLAKDRPENSGLNTLSSFEKEFAQEISFSFTEEYKNISSVKAVPEIPTNSNNTFDEIDFYLNKKIKTKKTDSIPSFDKNYSKKHLYEHEQTLENKAQNYNISFVNNVNKTLETLEKDFIQKIVKEPIYILTGHNQNNVTAEIFVPLKDVRENLQTNATYLCKTQMVESENQYFLLGF